MGRRLLLTQTGADLLDHIRIMGEAAESVSLAASGRVKEVSGRVCISATDTYSAYVLPEIVEHIRAQAPLLTIMIAASNELSNLHGRDADIAIRHVRPDRSGLTGLHIRDSVASFYASEEWVARHGLPAKPEDLARSDLIGFEDTARFVGYLHDLGIPMKAEDFRLVSDSSVVMWEMVRRGMGVAAMLHEVAERTPGVVRLVPDMAPISVPVWLVTHRELQASPRIRVVMEILADALAKL